MAFSFTELPLPGLILVEPKIYHDDRGFFIEEFKESAFTKAGITDRFVQDNHSCSSRGVLRGLHFQLPPFAQAKLVRVIKGAIWDVVVDIRPDSSTYLKWYNVELSAENRLMIYVPVGFAHGFYTMSEEAELIYKCSAEYDKASESGLRWNDPDLGITWPKGDYVVSEKDARLPFVKDMKRR